MTPFGDRVLIRPDKKDEKAVPGGKIFLPDTIEKRPVRGTVVEVGQGRYDAGQFVIPEAKPGDRVIFGKFAGIEIEVDGEALIIMRDGDILGRDDIPDVPDDA